MEIYADYAATTPMSTAAINAMLPYLQSVYGNPSSQHRIGQAAAQALQTARESIARCICAAPREITFTSGGSEADTMAIRSGALWGRTRGKTHLISTAFEHHAVLNTLKQLESEGFSVTLLTPPESGIIFPGQVAEALREDTALVSVMFANNEIGTIQPIAEIGRLCRDRGVLFHTDAVQAAGHLPIDVQAQNIDFLSLSAHKFYGPKGVGLLYTRAGIPLTPVIAGGGQERGKRGGTENVPGIAAMAAALQESCGILEQESRRLSALRDRLIAGLLTVPQTVLNGDPIQRLPGNVNVSFPGIAGESLLLLLDEAGICASSGSACASGSLEPSHVLLAIGRSPQLASASLRLTLGRGTTDEDVDTLLAVIPAAVDRLRSRSALWQNPGAV
ncbi:MAG: cysteine desulfurase family protein [Oscillospiraceae bacterium]|nr:cysteine desulfurase family protein [Oscillospiraceae bacterium]